MILGKFMLLDDALRLDATKLAACSDGDAIAAAALQCASSAPRTWARCRARCASRSMMPLRGESARRRGRASRHPRRPPDLLARAPRQPRAAYHDDMTAAVRALRWLELKFVRNFGATIVASSASCRWECGPCTVRGGSTTLVSWRRRHQLAGTAHHLLAGRAIPLCPSCCCGGGDDDGKAARRPRCALQGLFLWWQGRRDGLCAPRRQHNREPRRVLEEILHDRERLRARPSRRPRRARR